MFDGTDHCFYWVGIMLFVFVISLNMAGIPVYTLICYFGMDPIQATLEQCLNVPPSNLTFVFSFLICILLFMFICVREVYVVVFSGMILLARLKAEVVALNSYTLLQSEFVCNRYILLRRQHLRIEKPFSLGTASTVLFCQVMQCALLWMAFNCWMLVPVYMIASFVVMFNLSLGIVSFALETESDCQVSSCEWTFKKNLEVPTSTKNLLWQTVCCWQGRIYELHGRSLIKFNQHLVYN